MLLILLFSEFFSAPGSVFRVPPRAFGLCVLCVVSSTREEGVGSRVVRWDGPQPRGGTRRPHPWRWCSGLTATDVFLVAPLLCSDSSAWIHQHCAVLACGQASSPGRVLYPDRCVCGWDKPLAPEGALSWSCCVSFWLLKRLFSAGSTSLSFSRCFSELRCRGRSAPSTAAPHGSVAGLCSRPCSAESRVWSAWCCCWSSSRHWLPCDA